MATTTVYIDDRDGSITYSRPASGHHWVDQSSRTSDAYRSTLKLTRTRNASATVSFRGTSITVVGVIEDSGSSGVAPSSSYQIDGGSVAVFNGGLQSNDQYHVEFFSSGTLPMGQHTLVIRNLAEGSFFWLDQFIVTQVEPPPSDPDPSPDPTPVRVTTTVTPTRTTAPISTPTTPTVSSRSSAVTSSGSSSSSSSTITLRGSSTITTTLSLSNSNSDSSVSSSTPAAIPAGNNVGGDTFTSSSSSRDKETPVGAIVGFVLGGLSILLVILLIVLWMRRRSQRNKQAVKYTDPEEEPYSGYASPIPKKLASPFQSSLSEPYSATSPRSETSSTPMSETDPNSRAALVQTWRRTLGIGAHTVGKRQLTAFNGVASPTDTDNLPTYLPVGKLGAGERVIDRTSILREPQSSTFGTPV